MHAAHRSAPQARITVEARIDRVARDDAHGEARAGSGVPEVEWPRRLQERAESRAMNRVAAFVGALGCGTERAAGAQGRQHILAFEHRK